MTTVNVRFPCGSLPPSELAFEVWFVRVVGNDVEERGEPWTFADGAARPSRHGATLCDDDYALTDHLVGDRIQTTLVFNGAEIATHEVLAPRGSNWICVDVVHIEERPCERLHHPEFFVTRTRACGRAPRTGGCVPLLAASDVRLTHYLENMLTENFYAGEMWCGNEKTKVQRLPWDADAALMRGVFQQYVRDLNSAEFAGSEDEIDENARAAGTTPRQFAQTIRLPYWLTNSVCMHLPGFLMAWSGSNAGLRCSQDWVCHVFDAMFRRVDRKTPATMRSKESHRRVLMRAIRAWALTRPYVPDRFWDFAAQTFVNNDATTWPTDTGANDCEDFARHIQHVLLHLQTMDVSGHARSTFLASIKTLAQQFVPMVVFGLFHNPEGCVWKLRRYADGQGQIGCERGQRFPHSFVHVVSRDLYDFWCRADAFGPAHVHQYIIDSVGLFSVTQGAMRYGERRAAILDDLSRREVCEGIWHLEHRQSFVHASVGQTDVALPTLFDTITTVVVDQQLPARFVCRAQGCSRLKLADLIQHPLHYRLRAMNFEFPDEAREAARRLMGWDRPRSWLLTSARKCADKQSVAAAVAHDLRTRLGLAPSATRVPRPLRTSPYDRVVVNLYVRSSALTTRYPRFGTIKHEGVTELVNLLRGNKPEWITVLPDIGRYFVLKLMFRVDPRAGDRNYRKSKE